MLARLRSHPVATIFVLALALRIVASFAIQQYCTRAGRDFLIEGDANNALARSLRGAVDSLFNKQQ